MGEEKPDSEVDRLVGRGDVAGKPCLPINKEMAGPMKLRREEWRFQDPGVGEAATRNAGQRLPTCVHLLT